MSWIFEHYSLVDKYPREFKNQSEALNWMSKNKITPHHFQGNKMQLVPTKPHSKIRHSSTVADKRKVNLH